MHVDEVSIGMHNEMNLIRTRARRFVNIYRLFSVRHVVPRYFLPRERMTMRTYTGCSEVVVYTYLHTDYVLLPDYYVYGQGRTKHACV